MQTLVFLAGMEDQDASSEEKLGLITSQDKIELAESPGSQFNYCNTNYDILAEIVNRVLQNNNFPEKNLREYAQKHFFEPLGMENTGYIDPTQPVSQQTIPGYSQSEQGEYKENTTRNTTWGPCGIIGSPEDMVKWDAKMPLFDQLAELNEEEMKEAQNGYIYSRGVSVGYFKNQYKVVAHSGGIEGFMTRFVRVTDLENDEYSFSFFTSTNVEKLGPKGFDNLNSEIANTWIGKPILPIKKEEEGPPPSANLAGKEKKEELNPYEGDCSMKTSKKKANISATKLKNGTWGLRFKPNRSDPKMSIDFVQDPNDPNRFLGVNPPSATLIFSDKGFLFQDFTQGIVGAPFFFDQ